MLESHKYRIPRPFIYRRLHSIMGIMLILYLIEHLLTNSQAALFLGEDGSSFITMVNFIHSLPYLVVIELAFIAIPFIIHILWGIKYLRTAKSNTYTNTGIDPYLPEFSRNHAYTWQRITSWFLIFAVFAHVIQMRFIEYPLSSRVEGNEYYLVKVGLDPGLYTLASRLHVALYDRYAIEQEEKRIMSGEESTIEGWISPIKNWKLPLISKNNKKLKQIEKNLAAQEKEENLEWLKKLQKRNLKEGEGIAVTEHVGTAFLLNIRETFKSPTMLFLYSLFVAASVFHAFNGLWTFCITWGITLTPRSQLWMRHFTTVLMIFVGFLGFMAIWFSTLVNLKD
jgi:succinate dehydrogenase / fumarate reductase cytochrome b subunit